MVKTNLKNMEIMNQLRPVTDVQYNDVNFKSVEKRSLTQGSLTQPCKDV